jgi:hypothetical protein
MTKRPTPPVTIPLTDLGQDLAEVQRIKQEMTALLQELEHRVAPQAHKATGKPGGWRHDPQGWLKRTGAA